MRRDRLSFIVSFMPPVCMAFMLGFELLIQHQIIQRVEPVIAAAEVLPFLIPFLLILFFARLIGRPAVNADRFKGFTRHAIPFVLLASLATAALSFLLNAGFSLLLQDMPQAELRYVDSFDSLAMTLLLVVLLPSFFEELLFRAGILTAFEGMGTLAAIFISGLTFALVHGNVYNLVGPFAAGLVYGYLTYTLGSVWPAVFAHMVNNCFYLLITHMTKAYSTLGIWPYFLLGLVFVFGLLLYLTMNSLSKLLARGKIKRMRPTGLRGVALAMLFSPGLWLLVLMFFIKTAYL